MLPIRMASRMKLTMSSNILMSRGNEFYNGIVQLKHCTTVSNSDDTIIDSHGFIRYINSPSMFYNGNSYLIKPDVAKKFALMIKDHVLKNSAPVIEVNPGLGLLTMELLKHGVPFVHMIDKNLKLVKLLEKLCDRFPKQLSVKRGNLYTLLSRYDRCESSMPNLCDILSNVQPKEWDDGNCMQIIGTLTSIMTIDSLLVHTTYETAIMSYGRPIFYLVMAKSYWNKCTNTNAPATLRQVMFETTCNYEILGMLERKGFIPYLKCKYAKKKQPIDPTDEVFILVKIELKHDLLTQFGGRTNLCYFRSFVKVCLSSKNRRMIPFLERQVPGCGVRLIAKDYNVYTRFHDLSSKQMYDVFMEFRSWPEFDETEFLFTAKENFNMYDIYTKTKNCLE